jgi:putative copper export protein
LETLLGVFQGVDFLLLHLLIGSWLFSAVITEQKSMRGLAILTFASSLAVAVLTAASMSDSFAVSDLFSVFKITEFGHLSILKLLALLAWASGLIKRGFLTPVVLLPLTWILTEHAGASAKFSYIAAVWVHSLTIAFWLGGLWSLFFWLKDRAPDQAAKTVHRFSRFAMLATACILASGLLMAFWAGVSITHPFATVYGRLVAAKLGAFVLALGFASFNQFVHLRKRGFGPMRREIGFELVLVFSAFLLAGFLTRAMPPS